MNRITPTQPLLILGKRGILGQAIAHICEERNLHYVALNREELDITDRNAADETIEALKPRAVINAAAYTHIDGAERNEKLCYDVNTIAPGMLAQVCHNYGVPFVHFSSDMVFDGLKGSAYAESDIPNPINTYGRSKWDGEQMVMDANPDSLIIRTSAFFSPWSPRNFVHYVLRAMQEGRTFTAANDVIVSPTYLPDLVQHTLQHIENGTTGVLHLASSGKTTWAELAMLIATKTGYPASLIEPASMHNIHTLAERPMFSALCSERGAKLPYYEDGLQRYLAATSMEERVLSSFAA